MTGNDLSIPDVSDYDSDHSKGWMKSMPLMVSMLLHLSILSLYAAVVLPTLAQNDPGIHVEFVDTILNDDAGLSGEISVSGGFGELNRVVQPDSDETNSPIVSAEIATNIDVVPTDLSDLATEFVNSQPLATNMAANLGASPKSFSAGVGQGKGSGIGDGEGFGGPSSRFFKTKGNANSVVFVIDASKSMNAFFPGPVRNRFNRVQQELLSTVWGMKENQRFFIIYFGSETVPMPAPQLVPATDQYKQVYLDWALRHGAESNGTFPSGALKTAIDLQPEVVYFLTDGNFEAGVVERITRINVNRVPIHAIGFSDRRNENQLLELANKNNGTYTYIPETAEEP